MINIFYKYEIFEIEIYIKKKEYKNVKYKKILSDGNIYELRNWMYTYKDFDMRVIKEFFNGLEIFMFKDGCILITQESGKDCWSDEMLC